MVLMGSWMRGPCPLTISKGIFMPVSGVRMSEKRMTPSGLNACHGCREISTCKCRQNGPPAPSDGTNAQPLPGTPEQHP